MTCDQEETHVISFDTLPCVKRYGRTNIRTGGDKKYIRLQRHESCTREINRHRDVKPNHYDFCFRNKFHVCHGIDGSTCGSGVVDGLRVTALTQISHVACPEGQADRQTDRQTNKQTDR